MQRSYTFIHFIKALTDGGFVALKREKLEKNENSTKKYVPVVKVTASVGSLILPSLVTPLVTTLYIVSGSKPVNDITPVSPCTSTVLRSPVFVLVRTAWTRYCSLFPSDGVKVPDAESLVTLVTATFSGLGAVFEKQRID